MKKIQVACAILEKNGLVLAAQRSETMSLPLKWEFPGGKIEANESAAACLERALEEELGIGITILEALPPSDWSYPTFAITLHPFVCTMDGGQIRLAEHKEIRWVNPEQLWERGGGGPLPGAQGLRSARHLPEDGAGILAEYDVRDQPGAAAGVAVQYALGERGGAEPDSPCSAGLYDSGVCPGGEEKEWGDGAVYVSRPC